MPQPLIGPAPSIDYIVSGRARNVLFVMSHTRMCADCGFDSAGVDSLEVCPTCDCRAWETNYEVNTDGTSHPFEMSEENFNDHMRAHWSAVRLPAELAEAARLRIGIMANEVLGVPAPAPSEPRSSTDNHSDTLHYLAEELASTQNVSERAYRKWRNEQREYRTTKKLAFKAAAEKRRLELLAAIEGQPGQQVAASPISAGSWSALGIDPSISMSRILLEESLPTWGRRSEADDRLRAAAQRLSTYYFETVSGTRGAGAAGIAGSAAGLDLDFEGWDVPTAVLEDE